MQEVAVGIIPSLATSKHDYGPSVLDVKNSNRVKNCHQYRSQVKSVRGIHYLSLSLHVM